MSTPFLASALGLQFASLLSQPPGQPALHVWLRLCSILAWDLLDQVAVVRRASSGVRAAGGWGYTPPETGAPCLRAAAACCWEPRPSPPVACTAASAVLEGGA